MFYRGVGVAFIVVQVIRIGVNVYGMFTDKTPQKRASSALAGIVDVGFAWFIGASLGWW